MQNRFRNLAAASCAALVACAGICQVCAAEPEGSQPIQVPAADKADAATPHVLIDVDTNGLGIRDVFQNIARQAKLRIVLADDVPNTKLTGQVEQVPPEDVIALIADVNDLVYGKIGRDTFVVVSKQKKPYTIPRSLWGQGKEVPEPQRKEKLRVPEPLWIPLDDPKAEKPD